MENKHPKLFWSLELLQKNITKIFTAQKILKMENKHTSIFGRNKIFYQKIKKNLSFEIF